MTPREKAIEAGARALREQEWGTAGSWETADDGDRHYWRKSSAAAFDTFVAAIMEPDEAMIEAGAGAIAKSFMGDFTIFQSDVEEYKADALASHQAMIRKLMGDRG